MRNKIIFIFMVSLFSYLISYSQSETEKAMPKQLPSVALGVGILTFNGDVGKGVKLSSLGKIKAGYNLTIEERIGKYLGVSVNGMYGKLADNENSSIRNNNFLSTIMQGDVNVLFHFDNDFIFKSNSSFAPYVSAGIGFLMFDSYSDLKDRNGTPYQYWSDGSIRNIPESDINAGTSVILSRDYTYETKLSDSSTNYPRNAMTIPVGLGFKFKITDRIATNIGATYYLTMTDWIDNIKTGSNDKYIYTNFSLQYTFGKNTDESTERYKSVDFTALDNLDSDVDGVVDNLDLCPSTPKGIKVDDHGCPLDSDEDGIPDYRDKEPNSKKNALVDQNGVTLTDKLIAERSSRTDSLATERSQLFNENPSLSNLQSFAEKSMESRKNAADILDVPYALRPADKNKDGFISASELTTAISEFFEGDSNFTVEKLNDLIDFFFEQ